MAEKKANRAVWVALTGAILVLFTLLIVFGEIFQCQRNVPIVEPQEEAHNSIGVETIENPTVCLSLRDWAVNA
ncbi:hypothetical protein K8R78_05440 [bacterium]|nr:hypothetical protein [bacterium]